MADSNPPRPLLRAAARGVVLVHSSFVVFALLGGFALGAWPYLVWLHLPIALWAGLIMVVGWSCPLTPLEKRLREGGGAAGYRGGFVEHYLLPLVGLQRLTPAVQHGLGWAVLGGNAAIYWAQFIR